jgi:hypothetical protein
VFDVIVEIKTFAGDFASFVDDNSTDQRAGAYLTDALRSKFQRTNHHLAIYFSRMRQEFGLSQYHLRQMGSWSSMSTSLTHPLTRILILRGVESHLN